MDYYKTLYEHEMTWGRKTAGSIGRAQGNLVIADSILSTMDAFMDPDHFQKQLERVRNYIAIANNELDGQVK